ncbi:MULTISPECIES: helix-turn-helix transcriptional regulator [Catenuloplanes]|uniref:Excisionase family DNA binding protein n=2 Tax=Catenuloplanes TaxID=33874 RepID=A0AAE3ZMG6_9ACTN|nr:MULTISPECIES: helix-turn-helix domain-containing protein [Catenuloplanes]MDQ0366842.1 excisionase family DNA binding protein [Catenuloplanes indicus]MDR7322638.1 excisionase family DNA binding protein [Catenuloplanes niger]
MADGARGLWSHEEAAAYLGLSEQTLYFINHKGKGPKSYKVGKYRRYRKADIDAWLETECAAK